MAFFKDPNFDVTHRLTGFNRYRQLLYFYTLRWMKVNLLTVLGSVPLAAAIILSLATSSIVVLIPSTIVGGMIFGPFLAGMFDSIMRGLRDAPTIKRVGNKIGRTVCSPAQSSDFSAACSFS